MMGEMAGEMGDGNTTAGSEKTGNREAMTKSIRYLTLHRRYNIANPKPP